MKHNIQHLLFFLLLCLFCAFTNINAQNNKMVVTARVDTNALLIGDQIELLLSAEHNPNTAVSYPFLVDSIGKFEIVDFTKIDTLQLTNDLLKTQQKLLLTAWDSGQYNLPAFEFKYQTGQSKRTARTQSIKLNVTDLDAPLQEGIRPNKAIFDVPFTWKEAIPYILRIVVAILVILLAVFVLFKSLRKKKQEEQAYIPPPQPAHELALEKIQTLKKTKMWQDETKVKYFYSELTDIIREYIEKRFEFPALESTSDEIVKDLKKETNISKGLRNKMQGLFVMADLVKFAKAKPQNENHLRSLKDAEAFVQHTKKKDTESTEAVMTEAVEQHTEANK